MPTTFRVTTTVFLALLPLCGLSLVLRLRTLTNVTFGAYGVTAALLGLMVAADRSGQIAAALGRVDKAIRSGRIPLAQSRPRIPPRVGGVIFILFGITLTVVAWSGAITWR